MRLNTLKPAQGARAERMRVGRGRRGRHREVVDAHRIQQRRLIQVEVPRTARNTGKATTTVTATRVVWRVVIATRIACAITGRTARLMTLSLIWFVIWRIHQFRYCSSASICRCNT